MIQYAIRRLLIAVPSVIGVLLIVFAMVRLAPGDPAIFLAGEFAPPETVQALRVKFGLDRPVHVQFGLYVSSLVQGDLGRSTRTQRLVADDLRQFFPNTIELALGAMFISLLVGIPAGVIAAVRQNTWTDLLVTMGSLIGVSMPVFWFGLLAMLFFSVQLGWLPVAGRGTLAHLILPAVTLGLGSMAIIARMTRSSMLEVLGLDYVRTARAKGLRPTRVVAKHAFRNALIPVVTVGGLQFGQLLSGAVLTETVFAWPGIGRLLVSSISSRDYPVVQGAVLLIAVTFILINIAVDLLYGFIDPRIRYD